MAEERNTQSNAQLRNGNDLDAAPRENAVGAPSGNAPTSTSSDRQVADFIAKMKMLAPQTATGRGRLIFAMDATMSRQPTWDMALALQADMFHAVKGAGSTCNWSTSVVPASAAPRNGCRTRTLFPG
jgi:hypothetical protein